jgi:hypothetical protein
MTATAQQRVALGVLKSDHEMEEEGEWKSTMSGCWLGSTLSDWTTLTV